MADTSFETGYDYGRKYTEARGLKARLIDGFFRAAGELLALSGAARLLEVGCGEGHSTERLLRLLPPAASLEASDVEARLVTATRARNPGLAVRQESVYELRRAGSSFDCVLAMEVLEHLEQPERGLRELLRVTRRHLLLSVPREPLWRILNVARLEHLGTFGNTPGHVQHWSARGFARFVGHRARIVATRTPLPWTMILAEKP